MNKYEVAAIVAVNGLDDLEYRKLGAARQRSLFGFAVAGRKDISFDGRDQGTVRVGRWTDATNYSTRSYTYAEFAECVNERKPVEVE